MKTKMESETEVDSKVYCNLCNGEDLASICIWCHNLKVVEAFDKGIKEGKQLGASKVTSSFQLKLNKAYAEANNLQKANFKRLQTAKRNHRFCEIFKNDYPDIYKEVVKTIKLDGKKYNDFSEAN